MAQSKFTTVVGIFETHARAQQAVADLKAAGFTDDQISMAARDQATSPSGHVIGDDFSAEGTATGIAAGAGLGALWGLGVVAGVMPVLGPAVAAGSLAAILSSAAAGAAVAGLAGALVGMGIPKEEAEYYQREFEAGRVVIAIAAHGREPEARLIIQRNGGYDQSSRGGMGRTTLEVPVERDELDREREVRMPINQPPVL
jgi:hypothetical protein